MKETMAAFAPETKFSLKFRRIVAASAVAKTSTSRDHSTSGTADKAN